MGRKEIHGKKGGAGDGGWIYVRERREREGDMCKGEEGYVWEGGEGIWEGMVGRKVCTRKPPLFSY